MNTNETWGISGPAFLVVYILLAVVVLVVAIRIRRSLRGDDTVTADGGMRNRPEDVAYLNGGPGLAVYSALAAMHVEGSITTTSRGVLHAVGESRGASSLRNAIHSAAARPIPRRSLPSNPRVASALDQIRRRLEGAGLVLTAEQRRAYRRPAYLMVLLVVLGFVRLVAGVANGRSIAFLFAAIVVVGIATLVLFSRVPVRTASGDATLAAQRARHAALSPEMRPDWGSVGASAAALSVGVFGVGAMMAAEPGLAEELEAQKSLAAGGGGSFSGGGDSGWSDGGGSSGGDGGGGGGCGGGGCGGGGCGG